MNRLERSVGAVSLIAALVAFGTPASERDALDCNPVLSATIPPRGDSMFTGSQFAGRLGAMDDDQRESAILEQISSGNIPDFQRQLVPVILSGRTPDGRDAEVTVCVVPDYLAIGTNEDFMLVPMRLETALTIAERFGFMLPTRKIVDAVYAQATIQLQPQPLPASDRMRSTAYYWHHTEMVHEQRLATGVPFGALTAGDKKDLVITNRLWQFPDRVAIYGWHMGSGRPIQPLSTVHGSHYADYSHGVRLVGSKVKFQGTWQSLPDLLGDQRFSALLSDEGPMTRLAQLFGLLHQEGLEHRLLPPTIVASP